MLAKKKATFQLSSPAFFALMILAIFRNRYVTPRIFLQARAQN